MDFRDLLKQRRMVRHYEPEPVPRETLERICRTVRRAPSGGFSQGQRLIVVTDVEMRAQIAKLLHEDEWIAEGREPWLSVAPAGFSSGRVPAPQTANTRRCVHRRC